MEDFEEKLNSILSSPETMGQIMALASSLSGSSEEGQESDGESSASDTAPANPTKGLGDLLQGIDPDMVHKLMTLWGEYTRGEDERTRLLQALRPFLREERQTKLDRAVQIARISRVIRSAIDQFKGEGHV